MIIMNHYDSFLFIYTINLCENEMIISESHSTGCDTSTLCA